MNPELPDSRYDEFATWYAERTMAGSWVDHTIRANIEPLIGAVAGLDLLDLCCGEGSFARQLASLGASVTGVDLSRNLLDIAASHSSDVSISYVHDDARSLNSLSNGKFHGVTCLMALMDIPDISGVFQAVRRVVAPGGWFVIVITHPCFESPAAEWTNDGGRITDRYLAEGEWFSRHPGGVRSRVGAHHRTISSYVSEAFRAGWTLDSMIEPPNVQRDNPNPDIPGLLFLRFR